MAIIKTNFKKNMNIQINKYKYRINIRSGKIKKENSKK